MGNTVRPWLDHATTRRHTMHSTFHKIAGYIVAVHRWEWDLNHILAECWSTLFISPPFSYCHNITQQGLLPTTSSKRKIFRCMQSIWEITKERVYSRKDKNACISGEVKAIVHSCVYFHEYLTFLIDWTCQFLEGTKSLRAKNSSTNGKYLNLPLQTMHLIKWMWTLRIFIKNIKP